jgi:SAM-dependent methyltransferase
MKHAAIVLSALALLSVPPAHASQATTPPTLQSLAGHYEGVFTSTNGEEKATCDLWVVDGKLTGMLVSGDEPVAIASATIAGDRVVLAIELEGVPGTISGIASQGRIDGDWAFMGMTGKCVLVRTGDAVAASAASRAPATPRPFVHDRLDVVVADFPAQGLILDIGGGGEGVIAQLKGQQVVAIDLSKRELDEAPGKPLLKVVMDARDLKFTDASFPTATVFFTFMYIDPADHEKVFREIHRVLQPGGRMLVWDPIFPAANDPAHAGIRFPLHIKLPAKEIDTAYGVRFRDGQAMDHFVALAEQTGFAVVSRRNEAGWFFLELEKKR